MSSTLWNGVHKWQPLHVTVNISLERRKDGEVRNSLSFGRKMQKWKKKNQNEAYCVSKPASPSVVGINNGANRGHRDKIKINRKHRIYATGTCSLSCWWVTGLRNLFRFSRKPVNRLQLNCPSTVVAPIVSFRLFIFKKSGWSQSS